MDDLKKSTGTKLNSIFSGKMYQLSSMGNPENYNKDNNWNFDDTIQLLNDLCNNCKKISKFFCDNSIIRSTNENSPKDPENLFKKAVAAVLLSDVKSLVQKIEDIYKSGITAASCIIDFDKAINETQKRFETWQTASKDDFKLFKAKLSDAQNLDCVITALYWFVNLLGVLISAFQWKSAWIAVKSPEKVRIFNAIRDLEPKLGDIINPDDVR